MIQESFGFEKVSPKERTNRVKQVFHSVAEKYDLMNDMMSFGIHRYWKNVYIRELPLHANAVILDVAGGTGDIAFKIIEQFPHLNPKVYVCDLTMDMVQVGRDRGINRGVVAQVDWMCGNAEALPFSDESVDIYTISFGLRNVTNLKQALTEAYRVLKPGGYFVCLEFSKVKNPFVEKLYKGYSFGILPALGECVAKDRASYQYLVESIQNFVSQEELVSLLKEVDFEDVQWQNFISGVACIHRARK